MIYCVLLFNKEFTLRILNVLLLFLTVRISLTFGSPENSELTIGPLQGRQIYITAGPPEICFRQKNTKLGPKGPTVAVEGGSTLQELEKSRPQSGNFSS